MKKQFMLIAGFFLGSASFAMAGELEFQIGAGYFASFLENPLKIDAEREAVSNPEDEAVEVFKNMPLGFSAYGDLGYGFGDEQTFSIGGEAVFSFSMSLKPLMPYNFAIQGRGFAKYSASEKFSLTGFGGVKASSTLFRGFELGETYPVFGVRVKAAFIYLEYGIVLTQDFSKPYSHDIAIGFAFIN